MKIVQFLKNQKTNPGLQMTVLMLQRPWKPTRSTTMRKSRKEPGADDFPTTPKKGAKHHNNFLDYSPVVVKARQSSRAGIVRDRIVDGPGQFVPACAPKEPEVCQVKLEIDSEEEHACHGRGDCWVRQRNCVIHCKIVLRSFLFKILYSMT